MSTHPCKPRKDGQPKMSQRIAIYRALAGVGSENTKQGRPEGRPYKEERREETSGSNVGREEAVGGSGWGVRGAAVLCGRHAVLRALGAGSAISRGDARNGAERFAG